PYIQDQYLIRADKDPGVISQQLTRTDLEQRLAQVKHDGWAHVAEILSAGSSGTAAPIFGRRNRAVAALSVVRPIAQLHLTVQLPVRLSAARGRSQGMGQQSEPPQDLAQS